MKLTTPKGKATLTFLVAVLVLGVALFFIFFSRFVAPEDGHWDWSQWTIIGVWLGLAVIFYPFTIFSNYYLVSKSEVEVVRFRRKIHYRFDNIIYIDQELSQRKKIVCFFTRDGLKKYIAFDKQGKLYPIMLRECHNLISQDEFMIKYPNVKF